MGKLVRNLGAFSGGAATGYIGGREDMRRQTEADQNTKLFDAEFNSDKAAGDFYKQWWENKKKALIGNRNPAAEGAAAGAAAANPLGAAPPTPMLTQLAPNAAGPEAMQPAAPTPFITAAPAVQPRKPFLRTLSYAGDDLGE